MPAIEDILEEANQLRPVSDAGSKVMVLLDDPECGMSDLSDIIQHEPALTANVLKLANSAFFGLPGKIYDAKQAIIYLGMRQVIDLVLLVTCSKSFEGAHEGYGLERGELWKSAVSAAIIAQDLSKIKGLKETGLIFTAALMRDIGKVVLNQYVKSAMIQVLDRVKDKHVTFREAERQVLGFDHTQVGAMVAKSWNFPTSLQCILIYYHCPLEAKGCYLNASVVYLADALCRRMEICTGVDDPFYPEDGRVARSLGIDESAMQAVIEEFGEKLERINELFRVE